MKQSIDELRKQVIQETREQRERQGVFGTIPEWIIDIKMKQKQRDLDAVLKII